MLFGSDISKAAEVDSLFQEIKSSFERNPHSTYNTSETDALIKKLVRLLQKYPLNVRDKCNQDLWAEFIDYLNARHGGHSVNINTMYRIVDAMTNENSLIAVAVIKQYDSTICVYALNAIKSQESLFKVFMTYDANPPLAFFTWPGSRTPNFRGGEDIYTLLENIDDAHLLAGLRNLQRKPTWAEERVVKQYKYGRVFANRKKKDELIHTGGKKALKSFQHSFIVYPKVVSLYEKRLDQMQSAGLVSEDEKNLYLQKASDPPAQMPI